MDNIYYSLDAVALGHVNDHVLVEHPNFEGSYPVTRVDPGHNDHGRMARAIPVLVAALGGTPLAFGDIMDALSQIDPDSPMDRVLMTLEGHPNQGQIDVDDAIDIELVQVKDGVVYVMASED
jgi:hypothetical protein